MSSTPEEFLSFAVSAHKTAASLEFNYRNSASRAYYAAFHCCYTERSRCPELKDQDIQGSHDKLYARFGALPQSPIFNTLKSMAYLAKMMKAVRHHADYRLMDKFNPQDSAQQIKDAESVLKHWKAIQKL
jgi:uncharacterized protein (UPF0332 family)